MKHTIDLEQNGPFADAMSEAVETCVHCGFCLPACPTYQELGQEADSPRGRILLMKQVLEEDLKAEQVQDHLDQCLGCLACETACPSGVKYRDLISPYRATVPQKKSFWQKLRGKIISLTLPFPWRFRWALRLGQWTRFLSFLAPRTFRPMIEMIPDRLPKAIRLEPSYLAKNPTGVEVTLLAGCAQQVLAPEINLKTIKLLNECGVNVVVPKNQSCCGALSWHNGDLRNAQKLAARNFDLFPESSDWIVTNAAGCGSGIQEYELIFRNSSRHEQATNFAKKTIDISSLLIELGFHEKIRKQDRKKQSDRVIRVAYHDACHLSNGQGIRSAPRQLLTALPQVQLCELSGPEICCGSAGTYNIEQPAIANSLGRQKAEAIIATEADIVVTGNIGCLVQIRKHLKQLNSEIQALHLVEFLAQAALDDQVG